MAKKEDMMSVLCIVAGFFLSIIIGIIGVLAGFYFSSSSNGFIMLIIYGIVATILGALLFLVLAGKFLDFEDTKPVLKWYYIFIIVSFIANLTGFFSKIYWSLIPIYIYIVEVILTVYSGIKIRNRMHNLPTKQLETKENISLIIVGVLVPLIINYNKLEEFKYMFFETIYKMGFIKIFVIMFCIFMCFIIISLNIKSNWKLKNVLMLALCLIVGILSLYSDILIFGYFGLICLIIVFMLVIMILSIIRMSKITISINKTYSECEKTGEWEPYFMLLEVLLTDKKLKNVNYTVNFNDGTRNKVPVNEYIELLKIHKYLEIEQWEKGRNLINNARYTFESDSAKKLLQHELEYYINYKNS